MSAAATMDAVKTKTYSTLFTSNPKSSVLDIHDTLSLWVNYLSGFISTLPYLSPNIIKGF